MRIEVDDLSSPLVAQFLEEHLEDMRAISPPESKHALDLEALKSSNITFWTVWDENKLAGCGAIKELDSSHAEIKSMRTDPEFRNKGIASFILEHIIEISTESGYKRLSLETGSMPFFKPAHRLYEKYGFEYCKPFADYVEDPYSKFMSKNLSTKPNRVMVGF
ncbi:GNAT family N-acetyltransferase [Microbulbifer sp. 2304DJ12-6]|uniref:GNAT family N-acetyltransferase n=1 Tax=Microbulbifer sp. 2304DJ12-6 TaxID=3233340 RepID=UPI0039AFF496